MVGLAVAELFGFDLDALESVAATVGSKVDEVNVSLGPVPVHRQSLARDRT
jgi:hypothetical protein